MSPAGWSVLAGIVLCIAYCGCIELLRRYAAWGIRREKERTAAATFEADYIPEAPDVAATERELKVRFTGDATKVHKGMLAARHAARDMEREQADRDACVALAEVVDMLADIGIEAHR